MRWDKGVHERLEIGPPPLCQCIPDLPLIVDTLARKLRAHRRQPLIKPHLEALDLIILRFEIVSRPM